MFVPERRPERWLILLAALLLANCAPSSDGEDAVVSEVSLSLADSISSEDYQRAESFLSAHTSELVYNTILAQYWQEDDRLVYRTRTAQGLDYVLADLVSRSKSSLFDLERLAALLSEHSDDEVEASDLEIGQIELESTSLHVTFSFDGSRYSLALEDYRLDPLSESEFDEFLSPDGNKAAYIDGHNLWVRDTRTNELTQLTLDGVEHYGYATNNAGWTRRDGPVLLWSPDSTKIATFRHDSRNVEEMYLYSTQVGHPELEAWKYPLPGDEHIFMIERVVIHVQDPPRLVRLNMPPDPHRSTTSDHIAGRGGVFLDVEWSNDSSQLAFVSSSRDHKVATLRTADPDTGAVNDIYSETTDTYYESGYRSANWRVLHGREKFLWFSEKDNWGHLYLHELDNGNQTLQLTSGSWPVIQVQNVDLEEQQIYFTGA
ncbi:MAG: DPP IV N-terminal domain-containing protein, partial [Gammaproteobacteria bacterium]|nr:DPP IV N-terminal domain-containing protein [Gammaproteobacteria bacterium]